MAAMSLACGFRNFAFRSSVPELQIVAGLNTSVPACFPKYHNVKKKVRIHREKMDAMKLKFDRLDVEDKPTGCILCPHKNTDIQIDYKNVRLLSQFVSPNTGRIYGRKITGLCDKKQKEVTNAINRARRIGLMPITMKYFDFHEDPKLF
ncbi:small ribosomal subunit protein bS18-like [Clytia hemisphaerica]|uniref:Small ribosomal subunit protein bS18m n=1 Tax=Clytia hemisphaerica TaxID=252671 RepID=A0A7M5WXM8_9CNID|eukprot:TCONS_00015102-protein